MLSSEREISPDDVNPAANAAGVEVEDDGDSTAAEIQMAVGQDTWAIEGGYFVRTHRVPRTTLFSPLDVPDYPPAIGAKHIEILRVTQPQFADEQWPKFGCIEGCWTGSPSAATSLQNRLGDSFGPILPKAPKGKALYGGGLVRVCREPKRRQMCIH